MKKEEYKNLNNKALRKINNFLGFKESHMRKKIIIASLPFSVEDAVVPTAIAGRANCLF